MCCCVDYVSGEHRRHQLQHSGLVIDDENAQACFGDVANLYFGGLLRLGYCHGHVNREARADSGCADHRHNTAERTYQTPHRTEAQPGAGCFLFR
jgi:hypothetical protein